MRFVKVVELVWNEVVAAVPPANAVRAVELGWFLEDLELAKLPLFSTMR